MPAYTLTTGPAQDSLLSWIVAIYNREQGTTLTNQQYLTQRFQQMLEPFIPKFTDDVKARVGSAYTAATPGVQSQVNTLLGVTP